jgi:hypothetical protein
MARRKPYRPHASAFGGGTSYGLRRRASHAAKASPARPAAPNEVRRGEVEHPPPEDEDDGGAPPTPVAPDELPVIDPPAVANPVPPTDPAEAVEPVADPLASPLEVPDAPPPDSAPPASTRTLWPEIEIFAQ